MYFNYKYLYAQNSNLFAFFLKMLKLFFWSSLVGVIYSQEVLAFPSSWQI